MMMMMLMMMMIFLTELGSPLWVKILGDIVWMCRCSCCCPKMAYSSMWLQRRPTRTSFFLDKFSSGPKYSSASFLLIVNINCLSHLSNCTLGRYENWPQRWLWIHIPVSAFMVVSKWTQTELAQEHRWTPQLGRSMVKGLLLLFNRPAVTYLAKEITPLAGTKLYCLVTEAHRCK